MTRAVVRVNINKLSKWIAKNEPMGIDKLAIASRVSRKTLERMLNGETVGQAGTRWRVSLATQIPEEELFPAVLRRVKKTA